MKATWNGITIAESDKTIIVEGNHYFPPESIQQAYFEGNDHTTICPWKGKANYYTLTDGNGNRAENAAWYYAEPEISRGRN